ncbi:MAG: saccharopine dehydrogenase family protein [Solirubrobacteraceae bacterium]
MGRPGPVAVYGATGYTGRLVARELQRRGIEAALCGRNREKLKGLAGELGLQAPLRVASVDDLDALRHAFADCAVVINCAGPFSRFGEPVVKAAIESGTHYVDTTGEQLYMQRVFERFDDPARAAEVAVIPAMGFDYVPGDLICDLAGRDHEPLRELVVAYAVHGFGPTRGTMHSALEAMRHGGLDYRDGEWRSAGLGPARASFTFPEPIGRRTMVRYPSGEVVTAPRHIRTRAVTSLITASALSPHPALADLVGLALPGAALALRTPLKSMVDLAIDRLPEGPSAKDRATARFTIAALARGDDGSTGRGIVRGSDMYGLTAVTAVEGAARLAGEGAAAGVGSPASAFDATGFLDALGEHGVSYQVDGVPEPAAV